MLIQVEFKEDYRCFKTGDWFVFRPGVNLLVGDQGCGKSTLLDLISRNGTPQHSKQRNLLRIQTTRKMHTRYLDFEKQNPRQDREITTAAQLAARWSSHGQVVNAILKSIPHVANEDILFLIDEPDMALSIRSIYKLIKLLRGAVDAGCQVVMSVHNPLMISEFREVLSLEHKQWMSSEAFIATQKEGAG